MGLRMTYHLDETLVHRINDERGYRSRSSFLNEIIDYYFSQKDKEMI